MENVIETYEMPRDPEVPVVAMDEQPVQLFKEVRKPIPATRWHPKRLDYEYERAGTANIFMLTAPLECWRRVAVREYKTKIDWAHEIRILLEEDFPGARKVILVCDNLNTHSIGAFYEVFERSHARSLAKRLEIVPTPKHGSWLNIAENELSSMTRQCIAGRRLGDLKSLREQIRAWSTDVNKTQRGVDWQMQVNDARCKLKSVYPKLKL